MTFEGDEDGTVGPKVPTVPSLTGSWFEGLVSFLHLIANTWATREGCFEVIDM